ncbi:MAG: 16S rRNA (guanine(966)-N(2))-methyltransferase RsmD [Gammaproteobacteria bacterium]|nr:16S rRNA (guanine(966)-N(2))-methyltransferase RsmD [Gammaproteobacteria bacterium]NNC98449.1 16S rRNA (guanine(966)-N(2))-methyltransferase RsmD [Gammaproteobacteria bacterium]NNM14756.1 16S rRNA (guanine(966)-N(2))-methyltransferase RsmD [Gammaproteobacteria bacterium]
MSKSLSTREQRLRIIGGSWRSRKLDFAANAQLRPTPDRVRETLFNWIGHQVLQSVCLDLFAGSGALGLEALSRGASYCDFVDSDRASVQQIEKNLKILKADASCFSLHPRKAKDFLLDCETVYDLVFLDPPFHKNHLAELIPHLQNKLKPGARVYIEIEKSGTLPELPEAWSVIREKTAGQVRYHLVLVDS